MAISFCCSAVLSRKLDNMKGLEMVKEVVTRTVVPSSLTTPSLSLQKGNWVKLICGASFEDLADIRDLSLVYTLAGVDCIDCAAEASVVSAVNQGIQAARAIVPIIRRPWVMISVNDDHDVHFRKAEFDPSECPPDCTRPCELVCPANAISHQGIPGVFEGGVMTERCYGCGRCFSVCPYDKIRETTFIRDIYATSELLKQDDVDAIEIHTSGRRAEIFRDLWTGLGDSVHNLSLVAVSLPDLRDTTVLAMNTMYSIMESNLRCFNLWQLDGRPMSGDIGRGTTRETIAFARSLVSSRDKPKGYIQLAGGTNVHTVDGLRKHGLFRTTTLPEESDKLSIPSSSLDAENALVGGVAFGGYARKIVGKVLNSMQSQHGHVCIEEHPEHLLKALKESLALVIKWSPSEVILSTIFLAANLDE